MVMLNFSSYPAHSFTNSELPKYVKRRKISRSADFEAPKLSNERSAGSQLGPAPPSESGEFRELPRGRLKSPPLDPEPLPLQLLRSRAQKKENENV